MVISPLVEIQFKVPGSKFKVRLTSNVATSRI
jgi:hypothetical protein